MQRKLTSLAKRFALFGLGWTLALNTILPSMQVNALSGGDFSAGDIISDGIFFNGGDMSPQAIQAFLNAKVPVCDSWGQQPYAGTTRAAYGASRGYPAPYTCLKEYVESIPGRLPDDLCTGVGSGIKSSAQLIYEAGISCGVNPKALLVLLQREQTLVADDWPWSIQYQKATGFGCPDTAACDSQYYGFFNQVYSAARQFKRYARDRNLYSHKSGVVNSIRLHPNAACGSGPVYIANQATAGLYNYTPYQPNVAALNNLYGTGDGCSAYGNRNFWRMYNDWFGSSHIPISCTGQETQLPYVRRFYNPVTFHHFYSALDCDVPFLERLGYINGGPVFNTTPSDAEWATPVYRLYNPITKRHFWTTQNETPEQLAAGGSGYRQEAGVVFYVVRSDMPNIHAIQRFYNPNTSIHLWGAGLDQNTRDFLYLKGGYLYEGPTFYAQ
jgi:hypothetical protein